jgi:hypothetical protein
LLPLLISRHAGGIRILRERGDRHDAKSKRER